MIDLRLSLVLVKNSPHFVARSHKIPNCKKIHPLKIFKHFYKLAPLSFHIISSYQGENANKALFYWF